MSIEPGGVLLIILGFFYWSSAQIAKEIAYKKVRQNCQQLHLQMLDDYVALQKLSLQRDTLGRICIKRTYGFEFSATGEERYQGQIILSGRQVQSIRMDAYRIPDYLNNDHVNL